MEHLEVNGNREGDAHSGNFRPGVDSPPEPAQQEDSSRTSADHNDNFKCGQSRFQVQGDEAGENDLNHNPDSTDHNHVLLRGAFVDESLVEVVDHVRRTEVKVSRNG